MVVKGPKEFMNETSLQVKESFRDIFIMSLPLSPNAVRLS